MICWHPGWQTSTFATINVALALGWMAFVVLIGREHRRRGAVPVPE